MKNLKIQLEKLVNFLKKHNTKQVRKRILIISFLFILKLFLFSYEFKFWWWITWTGIHMDYDWISSSYIAIWLFIYWFYVLNYLKYSINNNKKKKQKWFKLLILLLILCLFSKQIFHIVSPEYKFYFHTTWHNKPDRHGNYDIDSYIEDINKYCYTDKLFWSFLWDSRWELCYWSGNLWFSWQKLTKVEDIIKLLEHAKDINMESLYGHYVAISRKIWLEKVLKEYNDKTFQVYLVDNYWEEKKLLNLIRENAYDNDILNLIIFSEKKLEEYIPLEKDMKLDEQRKYWYNFERQTDKMIKNMPWINHKLFFPDLL